MKTIKDNRFTDMLWHIGALVVTAFALGTMMITAYFRLQDKMDDLSTKLTRVETRLDDLLQRIPPIPESPRRQ